MQEDVDMLRASIASKEAAIVSAVQATRDLATALVKAEAVAHAAVAYIKAIRINRDEDDASRAYAALSSAANRWEASREFRP